MGAAGRRLYCGEHAGVTACAWSRSRRPLLEPEH
jgi:hypothetical protein